MKLYALCDQSILDTYNISIEQYIEIAKRNSAEIIQYRNKNAPISLIKQKLIEIRAIFDGILIVNDHYSLIEYCDGVHIGQEDLRAIDIDPIKAVQMLRKIIFKDKILGISTHNIEEVLQANEMDLNYIGLGAYRTTDTKKDISVIVGDKIDFIASHSQHKVAVIGGVKMSDKFKNITYHVIGSGLLK